MTQSYEEREKFYRELMNDKGITAISCWRLPNIGQPADEDEYRERVNKAAPEMRKSIKAAMK